jgi:hypothetical protein
VGRHFLEPPPHDIVDALLSQGRIGAEQAELARFVPTAGDLCAEADSGGHTDRRAAMTLLPRFPELRDDAVRRHGYAQAPGIAREMALTGRQAVSLWPAPRMMGTSAFDRRFIGYRHRHGLLRPRSAGCRDYSASLAILSVLAANSRPLLAWGARRVRWIEQRLSFLMARGGECLIVVDNLDRASVVQQRAVLRTLD